MATERKVKMFYLHSATAYHFPEIGQLDPTVVAAGQGGTQFKDHGFEITYNEQCQVLRLKCIGKLSKKPLEATIHASNTKCIVYSDEQQQQSETKPGSSKPAGK